MANSLNLSFVGLSVQDPYKSQLKLNFSGLATDTQKQSALKFWGLSADNAPNAVMWYKIN